jgi:hypothetical protein
MRALALALAVALALALDFGFGFGFGIGFWPIWGLVLSVCQGIGTETLLGSRGSGSIMGLWVRSALRAKLSW